MITALYAAVLALLMCALALNVIKERRKNKVPYSDGGVLDLQVARSAHSNAVDYIPIALILLLLLELADSNKWFVHLFGIALVSGRAVHAHSILNRHAKGRVLGMQITIFTIIGLSITNLLYFVSDLV